MNTKATQVLKKGILGDESENPYQGMGMPDQPINHQEAFEAQVRQSKEQPQTQARPNNESYGFESVGTYCRTGTFENGFLESDLKIIKQKGIEERCVSFSIISIADNAEIYPDDNLIQLKMEMKSEEQFNQFKAFISNLEWND